MKLWYQSPPFPYCRDNLSEMGREEEDSYREDLCSLKSDSDTIRAESPDSSRGDSNSEYFSN